MVDEPTQHDNVLIARIDERTKHLVDEVKVLREEFELYVLRVEFQPVKMLVFGLVGLVLSGVFAAIIALVINAKHL